MFDRVPKTFIAKMESYQIKYGHLVFNVKQDVKRCRYIGRGTRYGNPFPVRPKTRENRLISCYMFYRYLNQTIKDEQAITVEEIKDLYGKPVMCHCHDGSNVVNHDQFCHGLILHAAADYLVNRDQQESTT